MKEGTEIYSILIKAAKTIFRRQNYHCISFIPQIFISEFKQSLYLKQVFLLQGEIRFNFDNRVSCNFNG